jgi:hypothetical protein
VPDFFTEDEYAKVAAAADVLLPPRGAHPGGAFLGVADYIDGLLGAFAVDPPRIFAGGPFSGRAGGGAGFARFLDLSPLEELAWRIRIEGSRGRPEREFNGPVRGWQDTYRDGLAALGDDFCTVDAAEQRSRIEQHSELRSLLYQHACEGAYGAPEYGGNPGAAGWSAIQFPGDSQPRGYTDAEVSDP